MRYIKTPEEIIEAEQWFKNGDHSRDECEVINHGSPEEYLSEGKFVRRFRHPDPEYSGEKICPYCRSPYHVHGWIDTTAIGESVSFSKRELMVCPGDYIIKLKEEGYQIRSRHSFERAYTQYPELSPVEAVFGFASWLTVRKQPVTFSGKHDAAPAAQLAARFTNVQKLGTPREDVWPDNLVSMSEYDLPVGDDDITEPTPFKERVIELLQWAANLVGNPGTGISGSTDSACEEFQKKLRAFAASNGIKLTTYSSAQTGEELIKEERRRQIEEEEFTAEHDDQYKNGELWAAATCYKHAGTDKDYSPKPGEWPWDSKWWKPTTKLANLIKAGALYTAEFERINRSSFINFEEKATSIQIIQSYINQIAQTIDIELKHPQQ